MPIQLLWGDDSAALERAIQTVIDKDVDPCWASVNVSRLDGSESAQARQALEEAITPPFGGGARVVLLQLRTTMRRTHWQQFKASSMVTLVIP